MARIAGVDLPRNKRIEIALTYIYGIGRSRSNTILGATGVSPDTRTQDLTDEDVSRLRSLLELLTAAYGDGATVTEDELAPFLGDAGGVAPWDLTDAIDRGDTAAAIENLHRLAFRRSSPGDRATARRNWMSRHELVEFARIAIARNLSVLFALLPIDRCHLSFAKPSRRLDQRVEHRLQIKSRAADNLEHVGGGGLLLQ